MSFQGRGVSLLALTMAILLRAGSPRAQPAPQPPRDASKPQARGHITPPVLIEDPGVTYPKAALEAGVTHEVQVVLVLELDENGKVVSSKLEAPGTAQFDRAALDASYQLTFEPARENGQARAARIRYVYVFASPPASLSGRIVDRATGRALDTARVVISDASGKKSLATDASGRFELSELKPGKLRLTIAAPGHQSQVIEVELKPGKQVHVDAELLAASETEGPQPERAPKTTTDAPIEILVEGERPAPTVKTFTREEVRQLPGAFGDPFRAIEAMPGVTPIASGLPFFYVRGAPPGNVGYFLDGVRVPYLYHVALGPSVVHPGLVEQVDLYSGGYPARFGRFAGGIVAAETTAPQTELHGEGNVRLFDAGALVESGFADNRGTALVGARYSYTATVLSLVVPELKLDYRDYQLRVSYDLTEKDRLTLFGFGSYDLLGEEQERGLNVLFGTEFYRLNLRHTRKLPSGTLTTSATLGYDQTHLGFTSNVSTRSLAARTELHQHLGRGVLLRTGLDASLEAYSAEPPKYYDRDDPSIQEFSELFPTRHDGVIGVYADTVLNLDPRVEVTPGLRLDAYRSAGSGALALEPRIAARFFVNDDLRILHAHGIAHQPPAFVFPIPGLAPESLSGGLQKSYQTSAGVEFDLDDVTTASATGFYNAFFDMTDSLGIAGAQGGGDQDEGIELLQRRSLGSGIGFEVFVRRSLTQKLGGFLSYTLSRSWRSVGRESFPSNFDRTHVLNAALGYGLGRGYRVGGRLVFYTGTPEQPESRGPVPTLRSEDPARAKPFYRVDLRFEKKWLLSPTASLSFVAEVMNATLSKETFGDEEVGPITIPSIGVEGKF